MAAGDVVSGSQVNGTDRPMMSEQLWSSGVCVVEVWAELLPCGQVEVKAELSDGCFLRLIRTDGDLARMMKRLVDAFPEDRETLSSSLLTGEVMLDASSGSTCLSISILIFINNSPGNSCSITIIIDSTSVDGRSVLAMMGCLQVC